MLRRVQNIYSFYFPNLSLSLSLIFKTIVRNVTRVIFRNVYRSINLVDDDTELQLGGPACDISIFLHFYILQTFPWSPDIYKRNQTTSNSCPRFTYKILLVH